jgi:hypothetical protein
MTGAAYSPCGDRLLALISTSGAPVGERLQLALDVVRHAFSRDEDALLARNPTSSSGTSGWIALSTRRGIGVRPRVGEAEHVQAALVVFQSPPCMTVPT